MIPSVIETEAQGIVVAHPASVWTLVSTPERLADWLALCDKVELLDGEGLGMKMRLHARPRGKRPRAEIDVEVTAFDPPHEIAWRYIEERVGGKPIKRFAKETRFSIKLEPREGNTKVRLHSEQDPRSWFHRFMIVRFGMREAQRRLALSLQKLKMLAGKPTR
jgi:uncharacterized protein YndB with AHSA1/START domain